MGGGAHTLGLKVRVSTQPLLNDKKIKLYEIETLLGGSDDCAYARGCF